MERRVLFLPLSSDRTRTGVIGVRGWLVITKGIDRWTK